MVSPISKATLQALSAVKTAKNEGTLVMPDYVDVLRGNRRHIYTLYGQSDPAKWQVFCSLYAYALAHQANAVDDVMAEALASEGLTPEDAL